MSGPEPIVMSDEDKSKLQVSGLIVGLYKFKLTVTDKNNLNVSDEVVINLSYTCTLNPAVAIYHIGESLSPNWGSRPPQTPSLWGVDALPRPLSQVYLH